MFAGLKSRLYSLHHVNRHHSTLSTSSVFSDARAAEFLAAAATVESLPTIGTHPPEIVVTGRANVGKSTLLNAVLGRKSLLHTSKRAGRTKTLNFYRVGPEPGKAVVVDAPGYGQRGRPEWGALFDHYISSRKQLKRVYLLINASHGLKESDRMMLAHLNQQCEKALANNHHVTLQAVFTKCDLLRVNAPRELQRMQDEIFETAPLCLPGIITATSNNMRVGVDKVRQSIIDACGLGRVAATIRHN
ncbi:P-loop containing nucleoside triphosphate hydrolase protein [Cytidiella melzeri]|nr:P-loop containing nucleoside triphosphate hydrolase protein [Cytidiella melzeri]